MRGRVCSLPSPGPWGEGVGCAAAAGGFLPSARSSCCSPAPGLPKPCGRAGGRPLAGQRCLLEGHEHGAQAGHVFALLAALGVEVTQLGHLLPLCAWAVLLGFLHESLLRCPAGGDGTQVSEPQSRLPLPCISDALPLLSEAALPHLLWATLSGGLLPGPVPSDLRPQEQLWHQANPRLVLPQGLCTCHLLWECYFRRPIAHGCLVLIQGRVQASPPQRGLPLPPQLKCPPVPHLHPCLSLSTLRLLPLHHELPDPELLASKGPCRN